MKNVTGKLFKDRQADIVREILEELLRAKQKHPRWPKHMVARAGIIQQEVGELMADLIKMKYEAPKINRPFFLAAARKDALQVAAMAIRFIEALDNERK